MSIKEMHTIFAIGEAILFLLIVALGIAALWASKRETERESSQSPQLQRKLAGQEGPDTKAEAEFASLQFLAASPAVSQPLAETDQAKENARLVFTR